ncbi:MAG: hypothetical protein ACO1N9_03600 [Flavobacterium sp.]
MKKVLLLLMLGVTLTGMAQNKECDYSVNSKEDGKEIRTTKEYMMYERVFGGTSTFVFFSMTIADGLPLLNFQLLAKSKDFPKAQCFDKASKIYMQLENGKVVTLINALDTESCAGLMYDSENQNNIRVLTGTFLFTKGSLEELEKSRVTLLRVKYATEQADYSIRKELTSETNTTKYTPESYFMNNLKCLQ